MKEVVSFDSVVGLRILGIIIRCYVIFSDDDFMFSGVDCNVIGSYEGCFSKYVNIKIFDNESF